MCVCHYFICMHTHHTCMHVRCMHTYVYKYVCIYIAFVDHKWICVYASVSLFHPLIHFLFLSFFSCYLCIGSSVWACVCVCLCLGLGLCDVRVFVISNTQTYLLRRIHAPVIKIQLHTYLYSICIHKKGNWIKWFDWLTKVFFYSSIAYTVHISFVFSRFLSQVSSLT